MRHALILALPVAALILAGPAAAHVKPFAFEYKIVSASHSSSVSEVSQVSGGYDGTSSETWKLRGPSDGYPDEGTFAYRNGAGDGSFLFNVRGTYKGSVTTHFDSDDPEEPNHCEATVSTGDTSDNASAAPRSAQLNLVYDKHSKRVIGHWAFPMAILNPDIFPTSCSNPDTAFPIEKHFRSSYPLALFRHKRFTLSNSGQPGGKYGNYTWSTKITLTRHPLPR